MLAPLASFQGHENVITLGVTLKDTLDGDTLYHKMGSAEKTSKNWDVSSNIVPMDETYNT